jgi:hypothetical protein
MCGSCTLREIEEENDAGKRHVLAEPVEALRLARVGEGAVAVNGECGECQGWGGCVVDIDGEHSGRRGRGRVAETVNGEQSARSGRG